MRSTPHISLMSYWSKSTNCMDTEVGVPWVWHASTTCNWNNIQKHNHSIFRKKKKKEKKKEEEEESNLPETFVLQENIKIIFSINSSWYHFYSFLNSGSSCAVKWVDIEIVQFPYGFSWTSLMGILNLFFLKEENGKTKNWWGT